MLLGTPRESGAITFAEPGDNEPFTFSLADAGDDLRRLGRVVAAAERQQRLVENTLARLDAIDEAIERRIDRVKAATGVTLENYARSAPDLSLSDSGDVAAPERESARDAFHRRLRELEEAYPDKAADIRADASIEDDAKASAFNADMEFQTVFADPQVGPVTGFAAALAGGLAAAWRDPVQLGAIFLGGGPGVGRLAVQRIGHVALREAAINAGAVALSQPLVQDWRAEAGLKAGIEPALENVGMAALFGGIAGAAIQGVRELAAPARRAAEKVLAGDATPADVDTLVKATGAELSGEDAAALRQAIRETDMPPADPPAGVPAEAADEALQQALRHAERPDAEPPPDLLLPLPDRPAGQARVIDEALPGRREIVDGKPATFGQFDPAQVGADPALFQFKSGGDAFGVTGRLRDVAEWDALASGKVFVFETRDGRLVIADGHQRLGLAKRLVSEDAAAHIKLDGYRFREADGWTPADVRALAAKKNLQEGSADAMDAARILRDRPDILDAKLPVTGPMMKAAIALSRLSDEAFGMATAGLVPPGQAAAVGAMVADPAQHAAVMAGLARYKPETERAARLLIGEILSAGFRAEEQINLFGAAELTRSLMRERVRTLDAALQGLVRDKRLFGTLSENADTIEEAGNVLARGVNEQKASDAAALADMVARLAQRTGPVSDALNRAASKVAGGLSARKAADEFLDELRGLLDREGLPALLAEPKLRPSQIVEPGTPEAQAAAEAAAGERATLPQVDPAELKTGVPARVKLWRGSAVEGDPLTVELPGYTRDTGLWMTDSPLRALRYAQTRNPLPGSPRGYGVDEEARVFAEWVADWRARRNLPPLTADEAAAMTRDLAFSEVRRPEVHEVEIELQNPLVVDEALIKTGSYSSASKKYFPKDLNPEVETLEDYAARKGHDAIVHLNSEDGPDGALGTNVVLLQDGGIVRSQTMDAQAAAKAAAGARAGEIETIVEAAITFEGKIYRGVTHEEAVQAAAKALGKTEDELFDYIDAGGGVDSGLDGFVTSTGRYVDRIEALKIARAADQMAEPKRKPGALFTEDMKGAKQPETIEFLEDESAGAVRRREPEPESKPLIERLAIGERDDGSDVRFITRAAALEDVDKTALHADLIKSCKD